jgi:uncharacterized protein
MDKATAIKRVREYAEIIKTHFNVDKVILYGSYSRDSAHKDSDIDVAVVLNQVDDDFLATEAKLFRLRREIDTRIEPVLLEGSNDKSGFLEEILKNGEIIYAGN